MTAPTPTWRHKFRVTWNTPWYGLGFSAQWRYVGGLTVDALSPNPLLNNPALVFPVDDHLPSVSYLDLDASWRIRDGYTFRVGVNNVIDTDPPLIGSKNLPAVVGNGNTSAATSSSTSRPTSKRAEVKRREGGGSAIRRPFFWRRPRS